MNNSSRICSPRAILREAATRAVSRTFPAWIDANEYSGAQACAIPRVRDGLVLRLVAGRRQERIKPFINATGAP